MKTSTAQSFIQSVISLVVWQGAPTCKNTFVLHFLNESGRWSQLIEVPIFVHSFILWQHYKNPNTIITEIPCHKQSGELYRACNTLGVKWITTWLPVFMPSTDACDRKGGFITSQDFSEINHVLHYIFLAKIYSFLLVLMGIWFQTQPAALVPKFLVKVAMHYPCRRIRKKSEFSFNSSVLKHGPAST